MSNLHENACKCVENLARAEADLRLKGRSNPTLSSGYIAAANEVARVASQHFKGCAACQLGQEAEAVVTA